MGRFTFLARLGGMQNDGHVRARILVSFLLVSIVLAASAAIDSGNKPTIEAFHHVGISTVDMERSLTFYRDLLGCEVLSDSTWPAGTEVADRITGLEGSSARMVMLKAGAAHIELFQYASPTPKPRDPNTGVNDHGFNHLGILVADVDATYKRLKEAGVRFHCPPVDMGGNTKVTYGRDPDGNVFELMGPGSSESSAK